MNPCVLSIIGDGSPDMLVGELTFSWKVLDATGRQKSYELRVEDLNGQIIWESGRVESACSAGIPYQGEALRSNADYQAVVRIDCENGDRYQSDPVVFSTGLRPEEWQAAWLTSPFVSFADAPVFRRAIDLNQPIHRARLYICGLGYYELYLNGKRVGDRYMDPAWTDYGKRVNYVAYDLTQMLSPGKNVIGICLGAGWYSNAYAKPRPAFSLQVMLEYVDGSTEILCSKRNDGWMALGESWMLANTIYIGEQVDARRYIDGWCTPEFDCSIGTWEPAIETEPPAGRMVPMRVPPVRCVGRMAPQKITEPEPGIYVIDFGQNMAGIVELKMHDLAAGEQICLRFSEILDNRGMLNTENLRSAQERDIYISRGGEEVYKPSFTYHGFRYMEVTGLHSAPAAEDVTALVMRTDLAVRSQFSTSDPLINSIQKICVWTEGNNLHSVPTDCPQRDERLGWLNDLTVRLEEAVFNFEMEAFLKKYLVDIMDAQGSTTGAIPDTVPYVNYGSQPADPVCSSYLLIPYMIYHHYGDRCILRKAWDGIKAWTDYLSSCRKDGLVNYSYYGDWAAPVSGNVRFSAGNGAVSAITPGKLMSSGFLYLNCQLLQEIATVLGFRDEAQHYAQLAKETSEALNRAFLNREQGYYANNSQASNVFMLYLGIVPEQMRKPVLQSLLSDIEAHDMHLTTGNLCSRYILDVLTEMGQIDVAYALATQTSYPSWGYMLSRGATTTWERWEYVDSGELVGMASHDHPMYSTISGWFYKYLAGIRATGVGFDSFELRPFYPARLAHAQASVETVKGRIEIRWEKSGNVLTARVQIPFNSRCTYTFTNAIDGELSIDGKPIQPEMSDGRAFVQLDSGLHTISAILK